MTSKTTTTTSMNNRRAITINLNVLTVATKGTKVVVVITRRKKALEIPNSKVEVVSMSKKRSRSR